MDGKTEVEGGHMVFQSSRGGHTWKQKPAQTEAQSSARAFGPHNFFIIGNL